jgi:excisionase family DNA binding protein
MEPVNLTVREAAAVLKLGITKTRQLIQSGELLSIHVDRRVLIPIAAIQEYEAERLNDARAERDNHRARQQRLERFRQKPA